MLITLCQLKQLSIFSKVNILNVSPLINGLSHQLYKVTYNKFIDGHNIIQHNVLRFIKGDIEKTAQEYLVMKKVYELKIAPEPILFIDITEQAGQMCSLIVMDYIDADLASKVELNNDQITQLADNLNTLHKIDISSLNLTTSENNISLLNNYWDSFQPKTLIAIERIEAIKKMLASLTFNNTCLIHGDLNLSNILLKDNKMTWIDWEYASIGDTYFDYATLCVESNNDIEDQLIKSLERKNSPAIDRKRLKLFKLYYAATCWLWSPKLKDKSYAEHCNRYRRIVDQLLLIS